MERLTDKLGDLVDDLRHRVRVRRQLSLIAAYTMKERPDLRPVESARADSGARDAA